MREAARVGGAASALRLPAVGRVGHQAARMGSRTGEVPPGQFVRQLHETELAGTEPELQRHPPQTKVVVSRLSPSLKQHFRLSELQR